MLYDIYVFQRLSDKSVIEDFVQVFLKGFTAAEDCYGFPQFSLEYEFVTNSFNEMVDFVLNRENGAYTFYFNNRKHADYNRGIINLCQDGSMSLGLGVKPELEEKYLVELKSYFKSEFVFSCYNVVPPSSKEEVMALFS